MSFCVLSGRGGRGRGGGLLVGRSKGDREGEMGMGSERTIVVGLVFV